MKTFGILGLGSIGSRHALNLIGLGHDVKGYDPGYIRPERMQMLENSGVTISSDPNYVLGSDAIIIATPTVLHATDLCWALEHNKHVLVEKPISDKPLVLPIYDAELVVAVGNNQRFHPCVQFAKEWVASKRDELFFWAEFTVAQCNRIYTDHVTTNWGAHELDLAQYLLGRANVVAAAGGPTTMHAILSHPDRGCNSSVLMCYETKSEVRGFSISAGDDVLHADLVNHVVGTVGDDNWIHHQDDVVNRTYIHEIQEFIAAIDGHDAPTLAMAAEGLSTLGLILKIQEMADYE